MSYVSNINPRHGLWLKKLLGAVRLLHDPETLDPVLPEVPEGSPLRSVLNGYKRDAEDLETFLGNVRDMVRNIQSDRPCPT